MKLLLDEMYPPGIAEQLRKRGDDVAALAARSEMRGLSDAEVFAAAQAEERAVVTENVADFGPIAAGYERRGQPHHGLVLVDARGFPRGNRRTIGRMVTALGELLADQPDGVPTSLRHWL